MSRLDSAIRRLEAQRAILGWAVQQIADFPASCVLLEFGLGNGRTYDHLRELCPTREIFVFDRRIAAHPDCVPDPGHLYLGEFEETLPRACADLGARAALAHVDVGSGDEAANRELAALLAGYLPRLLAPGGIVAADQDVRFPSAEALPMLAGIQPGRYFLYRRPAAA